MQAQGKSASVIIKHLQSYNEKLSEYYKAKRAFDTENKAIQTNSVMDSADELGIDKFQCILSPNACDLCRQKTANGDRIFRESDLTKAGYGHKPPFHANPHSEDTEIYTDRGWIKIGEAQIGDNAISLKDDFDLEFVPIVATIKVKPPKMISFNSRNCDVLVSPDHRMFYQTDWDSKKNKGRWGIKKIDDR